MSSQPPAPPPPPPAPLPTPPPVTAVTPASEMPVEPPAPPMKSADDIVDDFLALDPGAITNEKLIELSDLPDGLKRIKELDLRGSQVGDEGLEGLGAFPRLQVLNLTGLQVSNAVLRRVGECKGLEYLILADTPVDNSGLIHISRLDRLRELDLSGTRITDAGFVSLKSLTSLESLKVNRNQNLQGREFDRIVEDGGFSGLRSLSFSETYFPMMGLQSLQKLKKLEVFDGSRTGMNDVSLTPVSKCLQLRVLHLDGTQVTALGMKKLAKLEALEELTLRDCGGIADIAFNALKVNKSLRVLDVSGTGCTEQAVQFLAARFLVDTDIVYNNTTY